MESPQSSKGKATQELDIYSKDFDPVAALFRDDFVIPSPAAPIFDNVEAYVRHGNNFSKLFRGFQS